MRGVMRIRAWVWWPMVLLAAWGIGWTAHQLGA